MIDIEKPRVKSALEPVDEKQEKDLASTENIFGVKWESPTLVVGRDPGRVAHLVRQPTAGVEVGETNFDGFSSHRSARRIRVPQLTASLMRWATRSPGRFRAGRA